MCEKHAMKRASRPLPKVQKIMDNRPHNKKGDKQSMKEMIFQFIDQYALWGLLILTILTAFLLTRIHSQLKRLNRSLGMVTGNIQDYFRVIMAEDAEEEKTSTDSEWENSKEKVSDRERPYDTEPAREAKWASSRDGQRMPTPNREMKRGERFLADGEREILASRRREQEPDDEEVFNSVLQEFFP